MSTTDPFDNLFATDACPVGFRCEVCGAESPGMQVVAVDLPPLGIGCLSICPTCSRDELLAAPPITVQTAAHIVGQHCAHVGVTLDEMGDVLREAGEEL